MNYYSPASLGNTFPFGEDNSQYQVTNISITSEYSFVYATLNDENGNTIKDVAITTPISKQPHHYCPAWYSVGSLFLDNNSGKWYVVTQIIYYIEPFTKEKKLVYLLRNSIGDFIQREESLLKEKIQDKTMDYICVRNKPSKPYEWDRENAALEKHYKQEPMWHHNYKGE